MMERFSHLRDRVSGRLERRTGGSENYKNSRNGQNWLVRLDFAAHLESWINNYIFEAFLGFALKLV